MNDNNEKQERGLGMASAFGGTGNNTVAAAGSLNGNNSVANSNTNYSPAFTLLTNYKNAFIPNNVVNKTEKYVTVTDNLLAVGSGSRSKEFGNDTGLLPFIQNKLTVACNVETLDINFKKGLKTYGKHKRLRNMKAFLLNKQLIKEAIYEAKNGKTKTKLLIWIMNHVDETVDKIYHELKTETYLPKSYRFRTIRNKEEKPRHLAILGFYDRCVLLHVKNIILNKLRALEPRLVYSNLPERGTLSSNPTYCLYGLLKRDFKIYKDGFALKMDIHHCYESISTLVLEHEIFRYVTDAFAQRLIHRMFAHIKYLPIGDPLSGLYVNLVLRRWHRWLLDSQHHLFDKCYFFCDDSLFINRDSKPELHELLYNSKKWLKEYANLYIKKNYKVYRLSEGVTFCGARIFPEKILVKQLIKKRIFCSKNNIKSLASYKGILDKTSSANLARHLGINYKLNRNGENRR